MNSLISQFNLFSGNEGWITFYMFCQTLGLECPYEKDKYDILQKWNNLIKVQGSCWIATFDKVAIMIERPTSIHMQNWAVHNEHGPAVEYKDGTKVWSVNGILLNDGEKIVMNPELQTIEEIDNEENNDIRALRIDRFGWLRYIKESGMTVVDERIHPRDQLKETLYSGTKGDKRLVVFDPATAKQVALGVPIETKTCAEAQNWMSHGADQLASCRT